MDKDRELRRIRLELWRRESLQQVAALKGEMARIFAVAEALGAGEPIQSQILALESSMNTAQLRLGKLDDRFG